MSDSYLMFIFGIALISLTIGFLEAFAIQKLQGEVKILQEAQKEWINLLF